jgi:hypothetical protein
MEVFHRRRRQKFPHSKPAKAVPGFICLPVCAARLADILARFVEQRLAPSHAGKCGAGKTALW